MCPANEPTEIRLLPTPVAGDGREKGGGGRWSPTSGPLEHTILGRMPSCGSLFSGVGLLDCGLHLAGFEHAWLCESDEWRRGVLGARFPGVPVFDDIRTLRGQATADSGGSRPRDTANEPDDRRADGLSPAGSGYGRTALHGSGGRGVPRVDLIAGGFPCRGISGAGKREGFGHPETVLWREMARAVGELRPRYVLVENVADLLVLHDGELWSEVVGTLASFGYDVRWDCVPAGAIGAPHLRDRVFAVGFAADAEREPVELRGGTGAVGEAPTGRSEAARQQRAGATVADRTEDGGAIAVDWGEYAPAIHRWEAVHGPAPEPLVRRVDDGDAKLRRVWARVDRSRLSACGDGVHVYVAYLVGLAIREHMRTGSWGS